MTSAVSGVSAEELPGWRETPAKQSIVEFVAAVTDCDSPEFVPERDRIGMAALIKALALTHAGMYAYDRDPILGSGTDQILAAAAEHKWTVIDMAADWATIHPAT